MVKIRSSDVVFTNEPCRQQEGELKGIRGDPSRYKQCGPHGTFWIIPCLPGLEFDRTDNVCRNPRSELSPNGVEDATSFEGLTKFQSTDVDKSFPTLVTKVPTTAQPRVTPRRVSEAFIFTSSRPNNTIAEKLLLLEKLKNYAFLPPGRTITIKEEWDFDQKTGKEEQNTLKTTTKQKVQETSGLNIIKTGTTAKMTTVNRPSEDISTTKTTTEATTFKISRTTTYTLPPDIYRTIYETKTEALEETSTATSLLELIDKANSRVWASVTQLPTSDPIYLAIKKGFRFFFP